MADKVVKTFQGECNDLLNYNTFHHEPELFIIKYAYVGAKVNFKNTRTLDRWSLTFGFLRLVTKSALFIGSPL